MKLYLILKDIIKYAAVRKKYWLVPFAIILVGEIIISLYLYKDLDKNLKILFENISLPNFLLR